MEGTTRSLHTEGSVGDYFQLESSLFSSFAADAYKAIDVTRNQGVCLWVGRDPLTLNSPEVQRYLERMQLIDSFDPPVCDMVAYAVDNIGLPFAVFPSLDGFSVLDGNMDIAEVERRFVACARLVEKLHKVGVALTDICGTSFWLTRTGSVHLIGVVGNLRDPRAQAVTAPPRETLFYRAPEQFAGSIGSAASDVYALGVLGYYLYTRHYPYGDDPTYRPTSVSEVHSINEYGSNPSQWVQEVLVKSLHPDPGSRYQNAGELIEGIRLVRLRESERPSVPARARTAGDDGKRDLMAVEGGSKVPAKTDPEKAKAPTKKKRNLALVGLLGSSIAVGVVVSMLLLSNRPPKAVESEQSGPSLEPVAGSTNGGPDGGNKGDGKIGAGINTGQVELESLTASDDPLAHELLITKAREAKTPADRAKVEDAIVARARRFGLMRTAEQVRGWLRGLRGSDLPPSYEPLLRVLNGTLPDDARDTALRRAYASNASVTLRVAAALSLDSKNPPSYQAILGQIVGDSLAIEDANAHSTYALILRHPELAALFGAETIQQKNALTDADVVWLLEALAQRSDFHVRAIADLALERNLLPPLRQVFLTSIRDKTGLPENILRSLTRAAAGVIAAEDIAAFGRWYDMDSERILYAVLASAQDPTAATGAFDVLAGKSLAQPLSGELTKLIRTDYWDRRGDFAFLVGVAGLQDVATNEDIVKAVGVLSRFPNDKKLINTILTTGNSAFIEAVARQYPDRVSLGRYLDLLGHQSPVVREMALRELSKVNNIGAIQMILDHYQVETDPKLRKLYEETFWFVKRRMQQQQ